MAGVPGGGSAAYVKQYGPALQNLTGQQIAAGILGGAPDLSIDANANIRSGLAPDVRADFATTPQFGLEQLGLPAQPDPRGPPTRPDPALGRKPVANIGARANAAQPQTQTGAGFWDIEKELSDADREAILKNFETQGIDVKTQFNQLVDNGDIDPGMIKKGKDGKLDRKDMAMFMLEFGLRTMAAGAQTSDIGGALGSAALGTIEGRRTRASEAEEKSLRRTALERGEEDRQHAIAKQARDERVAGLSEIQRREERAEDIDIGRREKAEDRASAERRTRIGAADNQRGNMIPDAEGFMYDMNTRQPVMVPDGKGGEKHFQVAQRATAQTTVTPKDVAEAVAKYESDLNKNATARVNGKFWSALTPDEKRTHLDEVAAEFARRGGGSSGSEEDPLGIM